jgi:hypothetical protein
MQDPKGKEVMDWNKAVLFSGPTCTDFRPIKEEVDF